MDMTATQYLTIILAIVIANFILDNLLQWLNLRHGTTQPPAALADVYEEDKYIKSRKYQRAQTRLGFITGTLSFAVLLVVLATGALGWLHQLLSQHLSSTIWLTLAFFSTLIVIADLATLPFQWYATFRLEARFGFNKTTPKLFITDKLKGYLIGGLFGGSILALLLYLILQLGPDFWWVFWLAITAFSLFMQMFYTSLILPLFNKLTPLEEGPLREAIEAYAKGVSFPLTKIFVIDGSKRSSKSNAFFTGMGRSKKVVLYDTLIENHSQEELVSILAHEIGHYKHRHIISGTVLSILQTGLMLFIMSLMIFDPELSKAMGGSEWSIGLNLIAFAILYGPISTLIGVFMNIVSRKNEYQADAFAATTYRPEALVSALKKLSAHNLSNLTPHPWFVFWNYSHPPLLQRVKAITPNKD